MGEEDRVRHRRLGPALRIGERRAPAAFAAAHELPELVEVVQHRHAVQLLLHRLGQVVVGGVHVAELGVAQRLAVALRDPDAVEHVGEGDLPAVGHVGVPVLPRVG
jgi:hypothetical protein